MHVPLDAHIHYKCSFTVEADSPKADWSFLIGAFAYWATEHYAVSEEEGDEIRSPWFYEGGEWHTGGRFFTNVETESLRTDQFEDHPQYWTLRFEHNGSEHEFRRWRTDIGVEAKDDGTYQVSTVVTHRLAEDYVGEKPERPVPTAPWFLRFLVSRDEWKATSGPDRVRSEPTQINSDNAGGFWKALQNPNRKTFAIVLAANSEKDEPKAVPSQLSGQEKDIVCAGINSDELARLLVGNAIICVCPSQTARHSINSHLPDEYRLEDGMTRLYRPGLDLSNSTDFKRHRFYTADEIERIGPQDVRNILIQSVGRRSRNQDRDLFTSLEDLRSQRRELRLSELRESPLEQKQREELEEELKLLRMDLQKEREERNNLEVLLGTQDEEIYELENKVHEYDSKISQLEYEKRKISSKLEEDFEGTKEPPSQLRDLPSNLEDAAKKIGNIFGSQIEMSEKAISSARDHEFRDIEKAWKCLWDMCTILYEAYFEIEDKNVEDYFNNRSQFDVATSPSSGTREDNSKMNDRIMKYKFDDGNEEVIEISSHLKAQSGDSFLRIHYHAYEKREKLIVGHCGEHLDTAGTHRRS